VQPLVVVQKLFSEQWAGQLAAGGLLQFAGKASVRRVREIN
jgi:hypothetical protein